MKILKRLLLIVFFLSVLSTSVSACFHAPYYIGEGFGSDDGLWLIRQYESKNPYYAQDIVLLCVPEMELIEDSEFSEFYERYYRTSGELCDNGSFKQQLITSVQLNGKYVDFTFMDIERKDIYYEISGYDYNEDDLTPVTTMKIQTGFLLNGVTNDLTINNHTFKLKYSEGVRPFWSLALIGIVLGFVNLFIRKIKVKKIFFILSIVFSLLCFVILRFDRHGLCSGCGSPGFTFVGIFLLMFFTFLTSDFLRNLKETDYKNTLCKIIYGVLLGIFILSAWSVSKTCWVS